MTEEIQNKGISRRTVVKGAAWSVPVIAAAVATPLASASTALDLTIVGNCSGDFRAAGLASGIIDQLATVLGLEPAARNFTVTAGSTAVPAGTVLTLDNSGVLNVGLIGVTGALDVSALNIVSLGGGVTQITLQQELPAGQSFVLDLLPAVVDVKLAATQTLALQSDPSVSDTVSVLLGTTASIPLVITLDVQVCA
ncbi:hypothetical protein [Microbacterium sp. AK031]|uniref:hypothetical protein n=1 Tax=Microbacterium sp. AK031 TaxID=2723076 RepID=UPI002167F11F|nr:hypothetical protein [Microbacterium sp. AK031]MCS3841751.1 hypothetical protein [Microbacterium sp. AK031]